MDPPNRSAGNVDGVSQFSWQVGLAPYATDKLCDICSFAGDGSLLAQLITSSVGVGDESTEVHLDATPA